MNFKEVQAEIANLEEERYKAIKEYTEKCEAAKRREEAALKAAEEAYKEANTEEYHKSQEEARLSHDAMQMFGAKLEDLKREPVMTKEQFDAYYEAITEHLGKIVAADAKKVRALAKDLLEIKGREGKDLAEGNMLIEHIQKDLLKDPCGVMLNNGNFVEQPYRIKKFKDYSVMEFLRFIAEHPFISDLVVKEEPLKYWGAR